MKGNGFEDGIYSLSPLGGAHANMKMDGWAIKRGHFFAKH